MLAVHIRDFLGFIFQGLVGWLLIYAMFCSTVRQKTEVDGYLAEINHLKKDNRHFFGQNRNLENAIVTLSRGLQESQKSNKESQLDREKLNVELVRRENKIRSMSIERSQERKVVRGRR